MPRRETQLEWVGFLLITACLGIVQFSIAASQILFGLAWLLWIYLALAAKERPALRVPAFFWPLAAYAAATLVSAAFSIDPR